MTIKCVTAFLTLILLAGTSACRASQEPASGGGRVRIYEPARDGMIEVEAVEKTEEAWKEDLTPEAYRITREKGTERPFSSPYTDSHEKGIFRCVACGTALFDSESKYDSGTGWPSFREPISPFNIREEDDNKLFVRRTEILCARCGAHLGHVFSDGPPPGGLRYCMNGAALSLDPTGESS